MLLVDFEKQMLSIPSLLSGTLVALLAFLSAFGGVRGQFYHAAVVVALASAVFYRAGVPRSAAPSRAAVAAAKATGSALRSPTTGDCFVSPLHTLLLPSVFLAERVAVRAAAVGYNSLPLYGALWWAVEDSGCLLDISGWPLLMLVSSTLYATTLNPAVLGFTFFVVSARESGSALRKVLPRGEAHVVAGLCGFLVADCLFNTTLERATIKTVSTTTAEHVIGRSALLAAWLFCVALDRTLDRALWLMGPKHAPAKRAIAVSTVAVLSLVTAFVLFTRVSLRDRPGDAVIMLRDEVFGPVYPAVLPAMPGTGRMQLVALWAVLLPAAVAASFAVAPRLTRTVSRKLFHFMIAVAFFVTSAVDPDFMSFMWSLAIAFTVVCEALRYCRCCYPLDAMFSLVSDELVEPGVRVYRTHIYLMLGSAFPLFVNHRLTYHLADAIPWESRVLMNVVPGLAMLGVFDAVAAVIGSTMGRKTWSLVVNAKRNPAASKRTIEGSLAGMLCTFLYAAGVLVYAAHWRESASAAVLSLSFPVTPFVALAVLPTFAAALLEATTSGSDNLEVPLFTTAISLLCCAFLG